MRFNCLSRLQATIRVGIAALTIFGLSGCSDSTAPSMTSNSPAEMISSVEPSDGATGVPLQSSISITFDRAMDTIAVRENFHLLGGADMREWMSSTHPEMGFDHMSNNQFTSMMRHLDEREMPGDFIWSPGLKSCEFVADSAFLPQEEYMMIMYEDGMMNLFMHSMGMMGGGRNVLMYHFGTRGR